MAAYYAGIIIHIESLRLAYILDSDHDWFTSLKVRWLDNNEESGWIAEYDFRKITALEALAVQAEGDNDGTV